MPIGKILRAPPALDMTIRSEPDGQHWTAPASAWRDRGSPQVGDAVEFEIADPKRLKARSVRRSRPGERTVLPGGDRAPARGRADSASGRRAAAAQASSDTAADLPIPYGFVPIDVDNAVLDTPVFHHGANAGQADLLSGELRCTLTALTALLAANDQYPAWQAEGAVAGNDKRVSLPPQWGFPIRVDCGDRKEGSGKKILEPLRLSDGRVLISDAAIKGMLRQTIGGLLSAPMERVAERNYSRRENIEGFNNPRAPRPAIVDGVDPATGVVTSVRLVRTMNDIVFLNDKNVESALGILRYDSTTVAVRGGTQYDRVKDVGGNNRHKLVAKNGERWPADADYVCVKYHNGVDRNRILHQDHHDAPSDPHPSLLVKRSAIDSAATPVGDAAIALQKATREHVLDDKHGHISSRHPKLKPNAQVKWPDIRVGEAVFVEIETLPGSGPAILSLGHNFRYRVAFVDTVCTTRALRGQQLVAEKRPELRAAAAERTRQANGAPAKLTGARNLFGYVSGGSAGDEAAGAVPNLGDPDKGFDRLAGRVSINTSIERLRPGAEEESVRFLRPEHGYCVALRVLGSPKPSAYEFYLRQAPRPTGARGTYLTYGDLVLAGGAVENRSPGLRGRKGYLHQRAVPDEAFDLLKAALEKFKAIPWAAFDGLRAQIPATHENLIRQLTQLEQSFRVARQPQSEQAWQTALVALANRSNRFDRWDGLRKALEWREFRQQAPAELQGHLRELALRCEDLDDALTHLVGEQAAIARFVSVPGTEFGFTVRFRDLRPWELAALISALDAEQLAQRIERETERFARTRERLRARAPAPAAPDANAPRFAQKLGHGRPLGMGSVRIHADGAMRLETGTEPGASAALVPFDPDVLSKAFNALLDRISPLDGEVLPAWFDLHRYATRAERLDYPRGKDGRNPYGKVFEFHSNARKRQAETRRT